MLQKLQGSGVGYCIRVFIAATICFMLGLALSAGQLHAATYTWIVNADGDWSTTTNWDSGNVPNAQADVADFSTINITADRTVTLDASVTVGALTFGDTDTSTAGSWIISGGNTLTLDNTGGGGGGPTITVNALGTGKTATINTLLAGTSGFTKAGVGTLVLTNDSNYAGGYSGGTTISGGTLVLGSNVSNGNGGIGSGTITFQGGTMSNAYGTGNTLVYANALFVDSGQTGTIITPNQFKLNGAVSGSGILNMVINTNNARADFQNDFSSFTGTLNLTGTGTVRLGINALTTGAPLFNNAGWASTTLSVDGVTIAPNTNSGGNTISIGALTSSGSTGTLGGSYNGAGSPTYSIGGLGLTTTYAGTITGNAAITLTGGQLTLTGSNSYTGTTTVTSGTLKMGNANALGLPTNNVTVSGTLDLDTYNLTVNALGGAGSSGVITTTRSVYGTNTITISYNNTSSNNWVYGGTITDGSGQVSLVKTGSGAQILAGANTFSGGTTVNGGVLRLRYSASTGSTAAEILKDSSSITLAGATLDMYEVTTSNQTNYQYFSSITINQGQSYETATRYSGGKVPIYYNGSGSSFTRALGGTFDLPTYSANNLFLVTSSFSTTIINSNGVAYVTLGLADWGRKYTSNTEIRGVAYTASTATALSGNADVTLAITTTTLGANTFIDSFRDSRNQATTIDLGGYTLTTGGILITSSVATAGSEIKNGTLQGPSGQDLVVIQNSAQPFKISSVIADNTTATALTKSATGTLVISGNNTFTGGVFLNMGTLQMGSTSALNSTTYNAINFGCSSTLAASLSGTLALAGYNTTVASLSTANVYAGTPYVQNANGSSVSNATLTVNGSTSTTFAGILRDGTGGGTLGLAKAGASTLTLSGANTYTGNTTINGGTLALSAASANNISTSAIINVGSSGILDVTGLTGGGITLGNNQILKGTGTVTGGVTLGSATPSLAAHLQPGASVGTLTVGKLTLNSGAVLDYEFNSTPANDMLNVTGSNGLTINTGTGVNLYGEGTTDKWVTDGIYKLFQFSGTVQGTGISGLSILNPQAGLNYAFGTSGSYVTLDITGLPALVSAWNVDSNGSWAVAGNWSNGIPNSWGSTANFLGKITAPRQVTLDGDKIAGDIEFNNSNAYTIAQGTSGTLYMDNNGGGGGTLSATIIDNAGSHTISAPMSLTSNTTVSVVNSGGTLTVSGNVSGAGSVTKNGPGTLVLSGVNGYLGGTTIDLGLVRVNTDASLGDSSGAATINLATMEVAGTFASARNLKIGDAASAIQVDDGITYTVNGIISNGALTGTLNKTGAGILVLGNDNTYTGGTVISAGTLQLGAGLNTGSVVGNITNNGALVFNRSDTALNVSGVISGTGTVTQMGSGTTTLSAANTFYGDTVISGGTLTLGNASALGGSTLNYNGGGTLSFGALTAASFGGLKGNQNLVLENANATPGAVTLSVGAAASTSGVIDPNLNNQSNTYSGILSGAGAFSKYGSGTLTLTGKNTFTGPMIVGLGTVVVAGTGGIDNTAVNGTLTVGDTNYHADINIVFQDDATGNFSLIQLGHGSTPDRTSRTGGSFTIQDRANVTVSGNFDLNNTNGGTTTNITNNISLNGGTLSIGGFIFSSPSHYDGSPATNKPHYAILNFNGGVLRANYTNYDFLPAVLATINNSTVPSLTANVQAGGARIDDNGQVIQINSPLAHDPALTTLDGGLTKIGNGTLWLTANNTYNGGTTIQAGTLQVGVYAGTSGSLGTGPVTNNGTLQFNRADTSTVPGAVSGSGGIVQAGFGGTTILSSLTNSYYGPTTVSGGTLILNGAPNSSVTVSSGAGFGGGATIKSLALGASSSDAQTLIPSDGTNLTAITVTQSNGLSNYGLTTIIPGNLGAPAYSVGDHVLVNYSGTIQGDGFGTQPIPPNPGPGFGLSLPIRIVGTLRNDPGKIILNVSAVNYPRWRGAFSSSTVPGAADWDSGYLNPDGTPLYGTLNWNEYSTATTLTPVPTVYTDGPPADFVYFDDTVDTGITTVNIPGIVTPALVTVDNNLKNYTFTGPGSISGATALIKTGPGTLTITNTNNYTGGTKISDGTLAFNTGVWALITTAGSITMDGGTLLWNGTNIDDVSGRLGFVSGKTATFDTNGNAVPFASRLNSGTSALVVKTGLGTLTFSSTANNFTGDITVSTGTLLTGTGAGAITGLTGYLGNASVPGRTITVSSGATLQLSGNDVFGNQNNTGPLPSLVVNGGTVNAIRYNQLGNVTLNGGLLTQSSTDPVAYSGYQFLGSITVGGLSASTIASPIAVADDLGANTIFDVANATSNANTDLIVSTILRNQAQGYGSAPGGLTKTGLGTMALTVNATYTGNTTVNAGTLDALNINTPAATVAVTGTGSVLNATSITANTLTIGTGFAPAFAASPVPEPATWAMLMLAAMGLGIYWRHSR